MRKHFSKMGFTLVELSLSIAFISILAITIAIIINDMILTYQKGLVLKQVNTIGSELIDDFRATIASSSAGDLSYFCNDLNSSSENCHKAVFVSHSANIKIGDETINAPVYGAFCSGSYSYIWNSGYFFNNSTYQVLQDDNGENIESASFSSNASDFGNEFRLLKVSDISRSVCLNYQSGTNSFSVSSLLEEPVELLTSSSNLALYDFYISEPAHNAQFSNSFYSGSFILATLQGGINIKSSGDYCATPSDYKIENFDYCAINKFNFAMQAKGV